MTGHRTPRVADELAGGASQFVRALWGFDVRVQQLPEPAEQFTPRRPRFVASDLWLPTSAPLGQGNLEHYLLAASAHISAHLRFGGPRFEVRSLKPAQIAIISLLEDARVERLAIAQYPGLQRLWAPYHQARADGVKTSASLLARLAHALHDDAYVDDDAWVSKARLSFLAARGEWQDASMCRRLGSALGNDLGQMRVQFNAKSYAVEPPYRDDNTGLWHFDQESAEDASALESEGMRRVAADGGTPQRRAQGVHEARPTCDNHRGERAETQHAAAAEAQPGVRYAEWDYVIQRERSEFCSVFERPVAVDVPIRDPRTRPRYAAQKRLAYSALRLANRHPLRMRRLRDGDRLDLPSALTALVDRERGVSPDPRVYSRLRFRLEPPALLLLLDLSESLNDLVSRAGLTRLELARNAATLLATSLASVTSDFAIHGFSSNGRHDIGYHRFKDFDEPCDPQTLARLTAMRAHSSTRLGAALRHAGQALRARPSPRKLLLVVSDGEPSDIDIYDPKYLLLDARYATIGNRRAGLTSFCIGLDPNLEASVMRIFGARNYTLLERLDDLPQRLANVYLKLSG